MDCAYSQENETPQKPKPSPSVSSPEMFDSDTETETELNSLSQITNESIKTVTPKKPTPAEIVAKSDYYLLNRIHKYLSGVPPPPRHTICQNDYSDFLSKIQENRHLFWIPNSLSDDNGVQENISNQLLTTGPQRNAARNHLYQHTKNSSRNLAGAFDACDQSTITLKTNDCDASDNLLNDECSSNPETTTSVEPTSNDRSMTNTPFNPPISTSDLSEEHTYLMYNTVNEEEAAVLTWPDAYTHKFYGIHYNRNKYVEEYENLTMKLCDRYIGAETQSTCNLWFSNQAPGSAKKRRLLSKRDTGQSPGKRLNHLTRRRRTFSSANLQGLGLSDRKQLILNIKKSISRKGKSPRGKSPRGKTPRGKTSRGKSPRSSAKKRVVRKLTMEGPSPYKSVLETSKRALFQSPERIAGPSELLIGDSTNPQKIKRALFPTPNKKEDYPLNDINKVNIEGSRKRKNEDELEGPKLKWAKSLSFDCSHELKNNYNKTPWEHDRHSAGNILSRSNSFSHAKSELSDTHRKKLLWAVAEALRCKGIGMGHPQFKQFASSLARTVKKFMPDLENRNIPRKPGSTSDRMLKLAKHHVIFLLDSKTPND